MKRMPAVVPIELVEPMEPPSWSDWVGLGVAALTVLVGVINYLTTKTQKDTVEALSAPTDKALSTIESTSATIASSLERTTGAISSRLDNLVDTSAKTAARTESILVKLNKK